jgi:hypothetical protein
MGVLTELVRLFDRSYNRVLLLSMMQKSRD